MENMDETSSDIKGFNLNPSNTSNPIFVPEDEGLKFDKDALYYNMSGEKYLIILNHHTFKKTRYFKNQQPSTRNGTDNDVKSLKTLFGNLGFEVIVFRDLEYEEIIKNLKAIATKDHSRTSCMCVTILSHGDKGGEVHAADRPYLLTDVFTIFEKQPGLVNKPKLFFVQACRGASVDAGNTVALDGEASFTVPTHADFLVLRSSVEDYLSYRDANGSWMIQALCHVVQKHYEDLDLLHMITLVNRHVAYERTTYTPSNRAMNNKKQMPETRFTLTKLLKF
uniref:Caspase-3 n=2 Tax=Heliothinae TaxID=95178 RepID=G0XQF8_HELAM|nr:caspase-3 [Helicoverpa armigera]